MPVRRLTYALAGIAAVLALASATMLMLKPDRMPTDRLIPVSPGEVPGWWDDDLSQALPALRRSCREIMETGRGFAKAPLFGGLREDWSGPCAALAARDHGDIDGTTARMFLEHHFDVYRVEAGERPEGLFTGYFEPEAEGSRTASAAYPVPVHGKPHDLVRFDDAVHAETGLRYGRMAENRPTAYFTRREIDDGALAGQGLELVWLKSWADLFFMQIQGSGRVVLPDGEVVRLTYAGKNARAYTAIGGVLAERGEIARADLSMQSIRAWMDAHPDEARALMWRNESYVFFATVERSDPDVGPPGAQLAGLTPGRSLAVDPSFWAYGTPVFLGTEVPASDGRARPFQRLLIAQDTGSAIRGLKRGDIFFGFGDEAAWAAGHMKHPAGMYVLLPKAVSARLGLDRPGLDRLEATGAGS